MMVHTVGELIEALELPGDDAPVFVSNDPHGGRAAARRFEVETERWPDEDTGEPVETVVIYPI